MVRKYRVNCGMHIGKRVQGHIYLYMYTCRITDDAVVAEAKVNRRDLSVL